MGPGLAPPPTPSAKEALKCFGTAFALLLAGTAALAWNASALAARAYATGPVVGGIHLLTLGWLSLSIFGALQVFTGVALGAGLRAQRLAPWTRWLWTAGALLLAGGLAAGARAALVAGALALGAALLLLSVQLLPALATARRSPLTRGYAVVALVSLWSAWLLGGCAALARAGVAPVALPPGYFSAHLLLALFGWVGAMIAGVGAHLVPMFALSRPTSQKPVQAALAVWAAIPPVAWLAAFFPTPWATVGWALAALASALWVAQLALFLRSRVRPESDPGLRLAALATLFLPAAWALLAIARDPLPFVGLLLVGWLSLFTLGIYHRVVPFLVWFARFAGDAGRGTGAPKRQAPPPRVKELLDARLAAATAALAPLGALLWSASLASGHAAGLRAGAALLFLSLLCAGAQVRTLKGLA
jgi:hypothetical protein